MKIVICGALGHIGSYLIRQIPFLIPDCEVVMIDNLTTQRYCSLFNLPENGSYRFIEGDVTTIGLEKIFDGCDVVIQLAAITDASASFDIADNMERINYNATLRVADACISTSVPMILASSTSVYCTQFNEVDESCPIEYLNPITPYARIKLKEEEVVRIKAEEGLRSITLRLGTIYGVSPGMRFHTAVNKFCWQAVMCNPLTIWQTAYHQKRPYLYLNDFVKVIDFLIKKNSYDGYIYNVVSNNATVSEVVNEIRKYIPQLELNFVEHKVMNDLSYVVLNKHLIEQGCIIKDDFSMGVMETIKYLIKSNFHETIKN